MVAVNIKLGNDRYLLYISGSKSREDTTRVAFNTANTAAASRLGTRLLCKLPAVAIGIASAGLHLQFALEPACGFAIIYCCECYWPRNLHRTHRYDCCSRQHHHVAQQNHALYVAAA